MDRIISITSLRNNISKVSQWIEHEKKPLILTKNGRVRFVLLDIDSYEKLCADACPRNDSVTIHTKRDNQLNPRGYQPKPGFSRSEECDSEDHLA